MVCRERTGCCCPVLDSDACWMRNSTGGSSLLVEMKARVLNKNCLLVIVFFGIWTGCIFFFKLLIFLFFCSRIVSILKLYEIENFQP